MEDQERQLIYSFVKEHGEEVQAAIRKFRGRYYADLRIWFHSKQSNSYLPTKKGVSFPLSKAMELRKAADRLIQAAESLTEHLPVTASA